MVGTGPCGKALEASKALCLSLQCLGVGMVCPTVLPGADPVPVSAVHRIGRTGRSGNTGIATTFINKACGEQQHRAGGWRRQLGSAKGVL